MEAYERLEQEWAAWAGVRNVVATASGTASLHLALEAMRLPQGSEVIVPELTMVACARAVTLAGLKPVFVDCREDNLLMDPEEVAKAVTPRTRAIMAVHVYGRRCDMDAINEIATQHDLCVVEDLAEAHGVKPHPNTDAACWSFYRNKIIAGEEGGACAFLCPEAAELARSLRSLGFTAAHDFMHLPRGHNYRMSNAHALPILTSLRHASMLIEVRREIEYRYDRECPDEWRMPPRDAPWVYDIRLHGLQPRDLDRVVRALQDQGIAARHGFKCMSWQPEYTPDRLPARLPWRAARAASEVLYLPLTPGSTNPRAFDVIRRALQG